MGKATVYHTKLYKLVSSKNVIHSEQKICRYIFGLNRYHGILQYNLVERFWCINWLISDFSKPLIIFIKKKIRNHILWITIHENSPRLQMREAFREFFCKHTFFHVRQPIEDSWMWCYLVWVCFSSETLKLRIQQLKLWQNCIKFPQFLKNIINFFIIYRRNIVLPFSQNKIQYFFICLWNSTFFHPHFTKIHLRKDWVSYYTHHRYVYISYWLID